MKKKLLITGGSGLLAINWAKIIRNDFIVVLGLHKRAIKIHDVHTEKISMDSIEDLFKDLIKIKPDIVINAAANTNVEKCEIDFKIAQKVNTFAASNISHVCQELNVKLVHISSDHIFSGQNKFNDENCIPCPINNYARTKLEGEKNVNHNNPTSLIIRTNFFGWGPDYRNSFSDFIVSNLRNNILIKLYEDVFYTPIIIDELVLCIHHLIELDECGIFNIVGNERISKYDFGIKVARCFGYDLSLIDSVKYVDQKNIVIRPMDMSLSNNKLLQTLNRNLPSLDKQLQTLKENEKNMTGYIK